MSRSGGTSGWEEDWRLTNATLRTVQHWRDWWQSYDPPSDYDSDSDESGATNTIANVSEPPAFAFFDNSVYEPPQGPDASMGVTGGSCSIKQDGDTQYRFRKFDAEDEKQLVVMHFKNLSHQRNDGEPLDPSRIEFYGDARIPVRHG